MINEIKKLSKKIEKENPIAASILLALAASMVTGREQELGEHVNQFTIKELKRLRGELYN